jgi:hypothetical protein
LASQFIRYSLPAGGVRGVDVLLNPNEFMLEQRLVEFEFELRLAGSTDHPMIKVPLGVVVTVT